ncbi:Dephospho-CoA kinase CAB5 [Golovinomyces cichoracearum]|uniref:Dephospho-CoA kinase CAB5 n=1 Tax=Golovinomyces cichoracearum TaxID=62708 RepID=A0A420IDK3_9PEZI|nr:Dephospho-CoA kinase CAB5 [Golovinomyces cichoracearum]
MLILGLTGSIATGKSSVSRLLSQEPHNLPVIDADVLARRVVAPGTRAYKQIVEQFSPIIPDLLLPSPLESTHESEKGPKTVVKSSITSPLNRVALGRCVFGDSEKCRHNRVLLNNIVHPAVRREMVKEVLKVYLCGHWLLVLDVPLLFEGHLDLFCSTVLVVAVRDIQLQLKRLMHRDPHLSQKDAEARIQSQADLTEKVKKCLNRGSGQRGLVIYNDGDLNDLDKEVKRVISQLKNSHPKWWTWLLWVFPLFAFSMALWHLGINWLANRKWEKKRSVS